MPSIEDQYAILQEVRKRIEDISFYKQAQSLLTLSGGISSILESAKNLTIDVQFQSMKKSFDFMQTFRNYALNVAAASFRNSVDCSAAQNALLAMSSQLSSMRLDSSFAMHDMIADMCKKLSDYQLSSITNGITISHEMVERISAVINAATPYMAEEQQDNCAKIILPQTTEKKPIILTFDRVRTILSFIISLYTFVVSLMPNPQLTKITEQNDKLIAIQEEELELERQQTEHLEDIANNLADIIVYLNDQIEMQVEQSDTLSDQPEDANNLEVTPDQNTNADALN